MPDPIDLLTVGVEYFQFVAIGLIGYYLYLRFRVSYMKLDYIEKLLTIMGLGLGPFFLILFVFALLNSETALIDTTSILAIAASVLIFKYYFDRRNG